MKSAAWAIAFTAVCAALAAAPAAAQGTTADRGVSAVPFYSSADLMHGVQRFWFQPQAEAFAARSAELAQALSAHCGQASAPAPASPSAQAGARQPLAPLQQRWLAAAQSWDRLSGVLIGPLVERRSLRQLDFTPTRPELIERAIRSAPADERAMERVGTPAKGLPALEWLLWTRPERLGRGPDAPACRYAVQVAAEIAREGASLRDAFAAAAAPAGSGGSGGSGGSSSGSTGGGNGAGTAANGDDGDSDGEGEGASAEAGAAISEFINQFVGGVERLRWLNIEKPLRSAGQSGKPPAFPRRDAGATSAAWAAQWQALRTLAVAPAGEAAPAPGTGLVSLEHFLRGWGRHELADRLKQAVGRADRSLASLGPTQPRARLLAASRELAAFKRLLESDVAAAMKISIGFSDADGD